MRFPRRLGFCFTSKTERKRAFLPGTKLTDKALRTAAVPISKGEITEPEGHPNFHKQQRQIQTVDTSELQLSRNCNGKVKMPRCFS